MKGEKSMNDKIDWKKKLTSRKFWVALCNFVANLIVAFGGTEEVAVKITAIVMAGATALGYIIAEGLVDASNKEAEITYEIPVYEDKPPADDEEIIEETEG